MIWSVFLILSAVCLLLFVVLAWIRGKSQYKSGRVLDPTKILFAGVMLSSVLLFIPIYINTFKETECGVIETILISIHNMIRLFIVDGEFEFVTANLAEVSVWTYKGYTILFSVLYVMAPLLTFGFVLSFFKNISAYKSYIRHYHSDVFIFSELNEKSLALAESLSKDTARDCFFVFTDVFEREEEEVYEMIEKAKELGAICFKKDIITIDFSFHSKNSALNFFTIGDDQSENISQALVLVQKFKHRENTNLYVFSTQVEAELLLASAFHASSDGEDGSEQQEEVKIKVRRVNEVRSLVTRILYEDGYDKIFKSAYEDEDGVKRINAVVVGMGQHGTEMTKALSWFCQMDGYQVEINSFDISSKAQEKFISLCPELMDSQFNGRYDIEGEARYKITVHSSIDVDTKTFDDIIRNLSRTTYVFVALGHDEKNISTAIKLRSIFARMGYYPEIQAVVYNTHKKEALNGITNFKKQQYQIDFIGDMKSSYSKSVILNSDIEQEALKRHMKWGAESEFWQYDYNYKSSVASAIHYKMKKLCGIPGIEKAPQDRSEEEIWPIRILEHRRWNAYMRSEGYVYGGTIEREGRNDLAKLHNCLVPFDQLPLKEQIKDDD